MRQLPKAIAFAADVHSDQSDKGGKPYILHCIAVMEDAMRVADGDETVGITAVLHDVIEDNEKYSHMEVSHRILEQFGRLILHNLEVLTHKRGDNYLGVYIPRIIDHSGEDELQVTIIVKMADLRDNMNILRQPSLDDRALLRLQKYHMAYRMLREARNG